MEAGKGGEVGVHIIGGRKRCQAPEREKKPKEEISYPPENKVWGRAKLQRRPGEVVKKLGTKLRGPQIRNA